MLDHFKSVAFAFDLTTVFLPVDPIERFVVLRPHPAVSLIKDPSDNTRFIIDPKHELAYIEQRLSEILYPEKPQDFSDSLLSKEILQSDCCMSLITEWLSAWLVMFLDDFSKPEFLDQLLLQVSLLNVFSHLFNY